MSLRPGPPPRPRAGPAVARLDVTVDDPPPRAGPAVDYVLPLRWEQDSGLEELTAYLRWLSRRARVIVVDGSPPGVFDRHAARWADMVLHVRPDRDLRFANGKVCGVVTGIRLARTDNVIIADDDVRYDGPALHRVAALLGEADLVRPQNYFDPSPWHARWDTARTLLNRALGADYPGTLGVRRSTFLRMGGYDGDAMFENLELIRTVRAAGGRELRPLDLYVRRLPPDARHFWAQRIRQAYDDLAQPARLAFFLAVLPALAAGLIGRRPSTAPHTGPPRRHGRPARTGSLRRRGAALALCAGVSVALAEAGRRRAGGRRVFPAAASLFAPAWILERSVCIWFALVSRLRGGIPYRGLRLRTAAHTVRRLRQAAPSGALGARKPVTLCDPSQNGLVAERPHRHSATVARPGSIRRPS
ncbi:glycosyltransferase family A protein [Sphaerisporangium sp. TRM90804]|uniref:glycosyltransferase n=1 Tax=Sphaerisporangium sp. TRM90804 TaxID=3031113 RepID=UPI00326755C9